MFGYLLGTAQKNLLLVKIEFNENKTNIKQKKIIDKNNATFICSQFKIIEIIDEYKYNYTSADIHICINPKIKEIQNLKINELYDKKCIFMYLTKDRALQDIYLFYSKANGIFKQYNLDGELIGKLPLKNGNINGIYKNYKNGCLVEEYEYKRNVKNGLAKKYNLDGSIISLDTWKNGILIKG